MNMVLTNAIALDAALPRRDVLLDAPMMRSVLPILGIDEPPSIDDCTLVRVNYQVGRSVRAVYRIVIDDTTHTVAARMFRAGKSADAFAQARRAAADVGRLRGIAHHAELDTVFWLFPNDRKIGTLRRVLETSTPVPGAASFATRRRLVAYAPEKSATIACEDAGRRSVAYAKVGAAHQAARDYNTYATLRSALQAGEPRLRLPAPLAYDHAHRTLWLEAIDGRRLADSAPCDEIDDVRMLGGAVATFHGLPAGEAPVFDRFSPEHLTKNAAIFRVVRRDVADVAEALASRLARTTPVGEPIACLHGDLHPKNAIVSGDRLALIDVEDVAAGPAAADIGSLVASFVYLREARRITVTRWARLVCAFLAGYEAVRPVPSMSSVAWHAAAALFVERASRAVTRIRPLGLANLPQLLLAVDRLLDRGLEL
jgi:aminoglycoside phosphotransferase (APT) family kinase protein